MGNPESPDRRRRVLRAGALQVLWALFLVCLVLLGIALLFGREVGYDISFLVSGGIAILVTVSFLAIYVIDLSSASLLSRYGAGDGTSESHFPERTIFPMKKTIKTTDAPQAIGPYSQAVEANGLVFVSGQIALDPKTGSVIEGDVKDQTKRVMENGKAILAAAGCGMERVVRTTIYLKNIADFAAVNEVYGSYFPSDPPARATVEVSRLPKDVAVEIDFIAVKG